MRNCKTFICSVTVDINQCTYIFQQPYLPVSVIMSTGAEVKHEGASPSGILKLSFTPLPPSKVIKYTCYDMFFNHC